MIVVAWGRWVVHVGLVDNGGGCIARGWWRGRVDGGLVDDGGGRHYLGVECWMVVVMMMTLASSQCKTDCQLFI